MSDPGRQQDGGPPSGWHDYLPPSGWSPPYPPSPPKGWRLGLPPSGPGSLASPPRRLGARLLDQVFFLPVTIVVVAIALLIAAPHFGPLFPKTLTCPAGTPPRECPTDDTFPGFLWLELTIFATGFVLSVLFVLTDAVLTARFGRTPGKAVLHIRPLHVTDRSPLTFWRALARAGTVQFAGLLSWLGIINYLWCIWDADSQCVHDKVVETIVVSDT